MINYSLVLFILIGTLCIGQIYLGILNRAVKELVGKPGIAAQGYELMRLNGLGWWSSLGFLDF
jgi:hypothetical protein